MKVLLPKHCAVVLSLLVALPSTLLWAETPPGEPAAPTRPAPPPVPARPNSAPAGVAQTPAQACVTANRKTINYPVLDAQTLVAAINANDGAGITAVLKKYDLDQTSAAQNPFLSKLPGFAPPRPLFLPEAPMAGTSVSEPTPGAVAGVLADLLRQATTEAALAEIQDLMKKYRELQTLFPQTWADLRPLDFPHGSIVVPNVLAKLKVDFNDDVKDFENNLDPALAILDRNAGNHYRFYVFEVLERAASDVKKKLNGPKIVDDVRSVACQYQVQQSDPIPPSSQIDPNTAPLAPAKDDHNTPRVKQADIPVKVTAFLSHALLAPGGASWVTSAQLEQFAGQSALLYYQALLGLAVADDAYKGPAGTEAPYALLPSLEDDARTVGVRSPFSASTDSGAIQALLVAIAQSAYYFDRGGVANGSQGLSMLFAAIARFPPIANTKELQQPTVFVLRQVIPLVGSVTALYEDISDKDYSDVIVELTRIASALTPNKDDLQADAAAHPPKANGKPDTDCDQPDPPILCAQQVLSFISQYGPAVSALMTAKTTADEQAALEQLLMPLNDPSLKWRAKYSFTLDASAGGSVGTSRLIGSLSGTDASRLSTAVFPVAQIGPEFSRGQLNLTTHGFGIDAVSIQLPLVDVGALTYADLSHSGQTVADSSWSNVLAPGAYLLLGLKFPSVNPAVDVFLQRLSLGIGGQYGPRLQKVNTTTGAQIDRSSWRFPSVELTFDLWSWGIKSSGLAQ